jgi:hypothetical protein
MHVIESKRIVNIIHHLDELTSFTSVTCVPLFAPNSAQKPYQMKTPYHGFCPYKQPALG